MFRERMAVIGLIVLSGLLVSATTVWAMTIQVTESRSKPPSEAAADAADAAGEAPLIIELDYQGGFTPPRESDEPYVRVYADGRVVLGAPHGMRKRVHAELPAARVAALRDFLLDEQKLGEFDAGKVREQVRDVEAKRRAEADNAGGLMLAPSRVVDAATTILRVRKDHETIEAKYYALHHAVQQYPGIESLARFHAAEQRIQRLTHELYAGGKESCRRYAELATRALRREHPEAEPIGCEHLESAMLRSTGERVLRFRRTMPLTAENRHAGGSVLHIARLKVTDPPDADPMIEMSVREASERDGDSEG